VLIAVLAGGILQSCGNGREGPADYMKYLNDPGNGLVRTRRLNGLSISAKYLSPELRAFQEVRSSDERISSQDSLVAFNGRSVAFLLTIRLDSTSADRDIAVRGVHDYNDFAARALNMNFGMQERLTLSADGREYRPVLAALDNEYGMGGARNITVVFLDEERPQRITGARSLDLSFADDIYETGINHFVFDGATIAGAPKLKF
jgi:hypothetical protein